MKKRPTPHVVKLVSSLTALVSLSSAVIAKVDPMNCLIRCGLGFLIGRTLASVWCALFASAATETTVETETEIANTAVEEGTTKIAA